MKYLKRTVLAIILIVVVLALRTLISSGTFKKISPHEKQPVEVIKGMVGAEDITIDRSIGKALVSSDDRRATRAGHPKKGAIYLLDFLAKPPVFIDLTAGFKQKDFHPHGISLYHDMADSSKWLFVVNHRESGHFIEKFRFTDSSLVHVESISNEKIISPNDVVGVGQHQFYFTNDHGVRGSLSSWKDFLLIGTGSVGYYDGKEVEIIDSGLGYANGINLSRDGKYVIAATTTYKSLYIYEKGTNKRVGKVNCNTGLDNIELDENGSLWIGCHPKMLAFLGHAKDPLKRSPAQVLKVDLNYGDFSKSKIEEVYLSNGNPLSGSSSAAVVNDVLLLGTVFEDGVGMTRF
ncbi:MAG TPA: hypothetical protein ENJ95_23535 [Bacteroidetes bacterium]|nr:hypothetical protein [Bacteroidota bacterium]